MKKIRFRNWLVFLISIAAFVLLDNLPGFLGGFLKGVSMVLAISIAICELYWILLGTEIKGYFLGSKN